MKKCNQCGAWIDFVTTQAGRHMPVEARPVIIRTDRGADSFITRGGKMVRGERGYTENCKDIVELSIYHYQDGKAGRSYVPAEAPGFSPHVVAKVECFLLACWVQGRRDAMEVPT